MNDTDYSKPSGPEVLDQDMLPSDIYILKNLPVRNNEFATVRLDRAARDYIVDALRARCKRR